MHAQDFNLFKKTNLCESQHLIASIGVFLQLSKLSIVPSIGAVFLVAYIRFCVYFLLRQFLHVYAKLLRATALVS